MVAAPVEAFLLPGLIVLATALWAGRRRISPAGLAWTASLSAALGLTAWRFGAVWCWVLLATLAAAALALGLHRPLARSLHRGLASGRGHKFVRKATGAAAATATVTATTTSATTTTATTTKTALSVPPAVPLAPPTIGRYRLVRELGRGGLGVVYLCHDPDTDRPVAIKTLALPPAFDADAIAEARARFVREAEAAGRLDHPDIVAVLDAGEARGRAFFVMSLAPGQPLGSHARAGCLLPVPTVVAVVARVARALAYAHACGVVHRDVKAGNVIFDEATGSVKVTDFGIATFGDAFRTRTGALVGTPQCMSPEQLAGRRVDGRSDLYSLGVMLFQLLTGEFPHRAASLGELLRQVAHEAPPDVRSLRPGVPPALAAVVGRALQKSADARHASGHAMADELERVVFEVAPPCGPAGRSEAQ